MSQHFHANTIEQTLAATKTTLQGLTQQQATERLIHHGANTLPKPAIPSRTRRLFRQFHNVLIYVLLASTAVTLSMQHYLDAAVIFAVVMINAIIGYVQEGKAETALAGLAELIAPTAVILREGKREEVAAEQLVVGDCVLLEAGARVPADLRLVQAHNLHIQEAVLTGESVPVTKQITPLRSNTPLSQRSNMAFLGTWVSVGQGMGIVTATGSKTEFGHIGVMLTQVNRLTTPLVAQTAQFSKRLSAVILAFAVMLLGYSMWLNLMPFNQLFMVMVSLAVAAIPEGLPAVMTITLAVGVQAMAQRKAIVRHLPSIETLGAVSVICTDKTGTLTRNEMMVAAVITSTNRLDISGAGYEPTGDISAQPDELDDTLALAVKRIAVVCNNAQLRQTAQGWQVSGDPMEGALLVMAAKLGSDVDVLRQQWHRDDMIPFDAAYRYMATLDHDHHGHRFISVKGAPEQLVSLCAEATDAKVWLHHAETLAAQGMRVIGLAESALAAPSQALNMESLSGQLTMVALVGFIDPPREEAFAAVQECQSAGINVKMITGDHPVTAEAIAQQVGIANTHQVLTGSDIDAMSERQFQQAVRQVNVFARTSPAHKLRLVTALQAQQHIVAMTGDGVNDAPAVKRADVGIVMGIRGSEAAKQAADVVLADDNFASIVAAVRQGRTVYDNLKKVISWDIPTSVGESLAIVLALLLGLALPVTPVQLLWINLVTAVTLGLTLAFEPTEPKSMLRPPRQRGEPLLSTAIVWHLTVVSLLFVAGMFGVFQYALSQGYTIDHARTMTLNTAVLLEIAHLFFIRNRLTSLLSRHALRATRTFWFAVMGIVAAQIIQTYWPPFQRLFNTTALSAMDVLVVFFVALGFLFIIEIEKQLRIRWFKLRL